MDDDLTSLASASLDGELTADERARVPDGDAFDAEVRRLRQIRAVLSDREPPSISMRERHLANALDAWDRLPSTEHAGVLRDGTPADIDAAAAVGVAALSSPTPISTRRRRTQSSMWLGAAAAGLVVVLGGGLVLRSIANRPDTDTSELSSADPAITQSADASAEDVAGGEDEELDEAEAAESATAAPPPGSQVETGVDVAAPPSESGALEELTGPDDLVVFATNAVSAPAAAELPDDATVITDGPADVADDGVLRELTDLPLCLGADRVVGPAEYDGVVVIVGIDDDRQIVLAYLEDDCSEVARASLR